MKKRIGIIALVLILLAAAGGGVWYFKFRDTMGGSADTDDAVFVDSVATITGIGGGNGVNSRYSGVVEAQETVKVEVASGMKVAETYVAVGQEVKVGTKLFSYDTDEAQDNITQLEIDIENYDITIESTQGQITQLEKERAKVAEDEKLAYTTQIMTAQNSIKRAEYEKKSKQAEMESLKKQVANAYVTSELDGVVKTINKNNSGNSDDSDVNSDMSSDDDSNAYMTIMATGDYRIKGSVNEQNLVAGQLMEGDEMIVHSRVDDSVIWRGTLSKIDRDNASSNQSGMMYYGGGDSSLTSSSSYPFYVELEDSTGLMLGQHVYVEVDNGQEDEKSGLWLDEYYLITDEEGNVTPYVWAATDRDRLEKREVKLGEYDEEAMKYEILSGLTAEDYIAWPDDSMTEGMPVNRNTDQLTSGDSDDFGFDDSGFDDLGLDDSGYIDDSGYDDEGFNDGEDTGFEEE